MKSESVKDVLDYTKKYFNEGDKLLLLSPIDHDPEIKKDRLSIFKQQGFARVFIEGEVLRIEGLTQAPQKIMILW